VNLEILEAPRFPGDDHQVRLNIVQLGYLCQLMRGIRATNPELWQDPNVAMIELQLLFQLHLANVMGGEGESREKSAQQLQAIRDEIVTTARLMEVSDEQASQGT
jgi:hypothetical protein